MANQKTIRVGLVGVGNWGRYGHIPALRLLLEYEIVAVASRSIETARELATEFGISHAFGDFRELVKHPDVDLVVVLPPAPQHALIVKAAIAAGKDVYCEWPLTTNTKDSEDLLLLAESAGVRHFVGLQRTVGASSLLLSDLVANRYIGDLRSARMHVSMSGFGPLRSKSLEWTLPAANFSHVLSIYGGHFLDMLFHAVGQPASLSAIVKTQFPDITVADGPMRPNETPDVVMVMGTLQNGAVFQVHIEGGKLHQKGLQIEITGTNGDLDVSNERSFTTKHDDVITGAQSASAPWNVIGIEDRFRTIPESDLDVSVQDLAQLYAAFARDRLTGTKSTRDFADAVHLHRLIDAIVDASSSHRTIVLRGAGMSHSTGDANKALVLKAFHTLFNDRDYEIAERFWSPAYIQHSAHIAPGREGLFALTRALPPTLRYENARAVANEDIVILHGRFSGHGLRRNWVVADIVRLENGLLVEHWDVIQDEATEAESKSGLPMFGSEFAEAEFQPTESGADGDGK